jgi:hypothetical protein
VGIGRIVGWYVCDGGDGDLGGLIIGDSLDEIWLHQREGSEHGSRLPEFVTTVT